MICNVTSRSGFELCGAVLVGQTFVSYIALFPL